MKDKIQNITTFMQICKDDCFAHYSSYIDAFAKKNVDISIKIKKVSHIKHIVTITAEIQLIPQKTYKQGCRFWKVYAVKLLSLQKVDKSGYKVLLEHKKSLFVTWILNKHLRDLSKKSPCHVCKENISNLLIRIFCFLRFQKFPQFYRGKDISIVYFIILMVFLAVIIGTSKNWYAWY